MHEIQPSAAIAVVALTVVVFIWRLTRKKKSGGCGGGCGSSCSIPKPQKNRHDFRIDRD